MIVRIRGYRDHIEYVALRIDDARDTWVTVRGDRGASGELDEMDAARLCVGDLRKQLRSTAEQARQLALLCDRRGRPRTDAEEQRMRELSSTLARTLAIAGRNLERLLDRPTAADRLSIDAEPLP